MLSRFFFLLCAAISTAGAALVTPPTLDWVSIPATASVGQNVSVGAGAHANTSDNSDGNDWNSGTRRTVARIMIDLQRPGQSTWAPLHDWMSPWRTPADAWCSFTVTNPGTHTLRVQVMDGRPWYSAVFYYTLWAPTPTPVITSQGSAQYNQNQAVSFTVSASGSPGTYFARGLPPGTSINANTGLITGAVAQGGTWTSYVSASNAYGTSPEAPLTWNVIAAVIDPMPSASPSTLNLGSSVTLTRSGTTNFNAAWTEGTIWYPSGGNLVLGRNGYGSSTYTPDQGPGVYTWQFRLVDVYGNYKDKDVTMTVLPPPPPPVPTGLSAAIVSPTAVNLSWNASAGAVGYTIFRNGVQIGTPTETSFADSGLTANTSYSYSVAARNNYQQSAQSSTVTAATPPNAPVGITATPQGDGSVALSWTAVNGVTTYLVHRDGVQIANSATPSHSDASAPRNTSVTYTLVSQNAAGVKSAVSGAVTALTVPAVPTGLTHTNTQPNSVTLSWNAVPSSGYLIYRGSTQIGQSTATSYTVTGLSAQQSYTFSVAAYNANNLACIRSTEITVTTPAVPPPVLVVTAPAEMRLDTGGSTALSFSWTAVQHTAAIAKYDVYQNGTLVGSSTTATFTASGLSPNTVYAYKIVAQDIHGNRSPESAAFNLRTYRSGGSLPSGSNIVILTPLENYGVNTTSWAINSL